MAQDIMWQKSSFSGGQDSSDCVELASVNGVVHLRESDAPGDVLTAAPAAPATLAALIRGLRPAPRR